MFKKIIPIVLLISLLSVAGCSKNPESLSVDKGSEPSSSVVDSVVQEKEIVNPLTGLNDVSEEAVGNRPVAIMVNNISTAQPVQTGLNDADVIYETEVEGGITRLMAVFQDVSKVKQIGSVRSARYPYIDLAMGHNAIYVYHGYGSDAASHVKDTDSLVLGTSTGGARVSNGLASEHTLYAYGDKLWEYIKESGRTLTNKNTAAWLNFADEESPVTYDNTANSVSVEFSSSYVTEFKYDSASGRYIRYFKGTARKDYVSGESVTVKNVFVLNADLGKQTIGKNTYTTVDFDSGDGYYFVNGTYTPIKWSKGASSNGLVFKNTDGTEFTVNPGDSWVCIVNEDNNQPVME